MSFADYPTARTWYRANNGSVVAAYVEHRDLAEAENEAERYFMNVVLCRVLYAHCLVTAPRLALGWLRHLAPLLADPRLGMTGIFLDLSRVVPSEYPLCKSVQYYLAAETRPPYELWGDSPEIAAALPMVISRAGSAGPA